MLSSGGLAAELDRFCSAAIGGSTGGPDPHHSEAMGAPFTLRDSKVEIPGGSLGLRTPKVEVVEGSLGLRGSMLDVVGEFLCCLRGEVLGEFLCCLRGEVVGEFPCCLRGEVMGEFPCCLSGEVLGEFPCFLCCSKVVAVGVSRGLKEELRDSKVEVVGASSNELRTASELLLAGLCLEPTTVGAVEGVRVEGEGYERVSRHEQHSHCVKGMCGK